MGVDRGVKRLRLDQRATTLVLDLLEQSEPCLSGAALEDFYPLEGAALLQAGLLKRNGNTLSDSGDYDDAPRAVVWSAERESYGYFDPTEGWVSVPFARVGKFGVAIGELISAMTERELRTQPRAVMPEVLWDLGELRLPHR